MAFIILPMNVKLFNHYKTTNGIYGSFAPEFSKKPREQIICDHFTKITDIVKPETKDFRNGFKLKTALPALTSALDKLPIKSKYNKLQPNMVETSQQFLEIHPPAITATGRVLYEQMSDDVIRKQRWLQEVDFDNVNYRSPPQCYKRRLTAEDGRVQCEEHVLQPLHTSPHYQVKHNSPWYINNPIEVRDSNVLLKNNPMHANQAYLHNWNASRMMLKKVDIPCKVPCGGGGQRSQYVNSGEPMSNNEVAKLRSMQNKYTTFCDWN